MDRLETVPHRFLALGDEHSRWEDARVAIVPVPYEATVSFRGGTREGPAAIIRASRQVELYDAEESASAFEQGIATLDEIEPIAAGPEAMIEGLTTLARDIFSQEKIPAVLGGEHTVSLGFIRAAAWLYDDLTVLQLDAHADMRDTYQGSGFSHACVMRRALELAPVVGAGLRSFSAQEHQFMESSGLEPLMAKDMLDGTRWLGPLVDRLTHNVYLTIDLDVFDPGIMPAVGTPEPGGLGWYEVVALVREVAKRKNIVGFDLVELAPLPGMVGPDFLAARLAYKIMILILSQAKA